MPIGAFFNGIYAKKALNFEETELFWIINIEETEFYRIKNLEETEYFTYNNFEETEPKIKKCL